MQRPANIFPLVRHLSVRVTPLLSSSPLRANHVTALSLLSGLGAAFIFALSGEPNSIIGSALLICSYILDNCDGEIARIKGQSSEFGRRFDDFVDWAVHTAFFAGLGFGVSAVSHERLWLWLGGIAAAGGTINYVIGMIAAERDRGREPVAADPPASVPSRRPENWRQWVLFAFRELSRADFCFIVLALALADLSWVLLPLGAIGAQVYWLARLVPAAKDYHV